MVDGNNIHHQNKDLRRNFQNDLSPDVGVMAPAIDFFYVFTTFKISETIRQTLMKVGRIGFLGIWYHNMAGIPKAYKYLTQSHPIGYL